jgi:endonuclease/exonuclease/phosphatase family metal-dependent hydrolase
MIRVMSFNLRYGTADDGENGWENRRILTMECIHAFGPDLLGVQECQDNFQAEYLRDNLPGYGFAGVRRGGEEHLMGKIVNLAPLEMTGIFYREASFNLLATDTFWLSKTPDVPGSKNWGSMFPRTVTWARLKSKQPPFSEIYFFNAHFDHFSRKARRESAKMLCERMVEVGDVPVILSGDFNTLKDYKAYKTIISAGFHDVYRVVHPPGRIREGTFHDYGRIPPMAIDWMFVSGHFRVLEAEIDRFQVENRFPSDHYPLTAVIDS